MRAIDIVLDKPRRLRFDMRALRALETDVRRELGIPLQEAMARWFSVVARLLVLHGLRPDDPRLTLDKVEVMLQHTIDQGGDVAKVYEAAARALRLSGVLGTEAQQAAQAEIDAEDQADASDPSEPALS